MSDLGDTQALIEYAKTADIADDPLVIDLVAAVESLLRERDEAREAYESEMGRPVDWSYRVQQEGAVPSPFDVIPKKQMLMTHPHDGHGPDDTCFECEQEGAEQ